MTLKAGKYSIVSPSKLLSQGIIENVGKDKQCWWRHECMWRLLLIWVLGQTSSWRLPASQRDLKYYIVLIWNLNNDHQPACKIENVVTINCIFGLSRLIMYTYLVWTNAGTNLKYIMVSLMIPTSWIKRTISIFSTNHIVQGKWSTFQESIRNQASNQQLNHIKEAPLHFCPL